MFIPVYIPDNNSEANLSALRNLTDESISLEAEEHEILELLLLHPNLSPYDVYLLKKNVKYYSKNGLTSSWYTQTHRRFKNLEKQGLIELLYDQYLGESKRMKKKIPCRLSLKGLIYLISLDMDGFHDEFIKQILANYNTNLIFTLFLYPYLNENTLIKNKNYMIFDLIFTFLKDVCDILPRNLRKLDTLIYQKDENKYIIDTIFIWPKNIIINDLKFDDTRLREYLQNIHSWNWINQSRISADYDTNIIRIDNPHCSNDILELYVDTRTRKATLRLNGSEIDSFVMAFDPTPEYEELVLMVGKKTNQRASDFLLQKLVYLFKNNIQSLLLNLREEMSNDEETSLLFRKDDQLMKSMKYFNLI